jgi:hypothetical protein
VSSTDYHCCRTSRLRQLLCVLSARMRNRSGSAYFGVLPADLTLRNSLSHL